MSAGQNVGPLDREARRLFQPPLPPDEATWALAAAAGISTVGLRPSFVIPAAAHSHPDCRAVLILIVAPQVQGLDEIEWLITRYLKRANVLLDVSRITSGKLALERLPVDVCEVAREVIENFSPLRRRAGSDLTLDLPGEPVLVSGDRLAIEEILDNLVSNAIKYGANKPILLRIGVDAEQHCAVIRVSDTGSGISADDQARIFERFERAVQPGEHLHGFGVGLWIVQQLCQGWKVLCAWIAPRAVDPRSVWHCRFSLRKTLNEP